jgi:hypothetical protein
VWWKGINIDWNGEAVRFCGMRREGVCGGGGNRPPLLVALLMKSFGVWKVG